MKKFFGHAKVYILRGLLALIPLGLTYLVVRLLYLTIDRKIALFIQQFTGISIPGLGIILLLIFLYIVGAVASNVIGQQMLHLVEKLTGKIPIINTTYQIGKQLSVTLSLPEKQVFKRVVLVDYLKPGIWTIGFVTGSVTDTGNNNEKLLKVFIPTPPNPTSGTMVLVKEEQTRDPGWTIEEAMRTVISGGIIGPDKV